MSKHFRIEARLAAGEMIAGPEVEHRFTRVLRARLGEVFVVCDASGGLWRAQVAGLVPFGLTVIGPAHAPDRNPKRPLEVWVPLLKGGRADDLVRQLTELGATRIVPYASRFAVVRLDASRVRDRHQRMQSIAREASNQCGRTLLPEIVVPVDGLPSDGPGAFLWEGGGASAREVLATGVDRILVGPEGGLHEDEAESLIALGWTPVSLGSRILRAETAVVAFAALAIAASHGFDP